MKLGVNQLASIENQLSLKRCHVAITLSESMELSMCLTPVSEL
jgi:hypothetical protein